MAKKCQLNGVIRNSVQNLCPFCAHSYAMCLHMVLFSKVISHWTCDQHG